MFAPHRYYYLHNFQRSLDWIDERYGDLLDAAERTFLTQFARLGQSSQALLVRVLMRRGPWFLQTKLVYEEIPDLADALVPLLDLGWLDAQQPLGLDELFALHTKAELLLVFGGATIHRHMRKAEMLGALRLINDVQKTYAAWNPHSRQIALRVMVGELDERLRLMFFGNLRQGWSEFVLAELGVFQYERVSFDAGSRAFQSRDDVDCYLALHRCSLALEEGDNVRTVLQAASECTSPSPWLQTRRDKLLHRIGQACERAQDWECAEAAYAQTFYPGARHRRIRVYERAQRYADALQLATVAEKAPETEEEGQRVQRVLARLHRRLGIPSNRCVRRTAVFAPVRLEVELDAPAEETTVERALRDHWHSERAPVFYVENALVNSLFGLLCWDAVFAPLAGAFFHPFQSGPADLNAADFVKRRQAAFDVSLCKLDDGTYRDTVRKCYREKYGVQSPFVFWGVLSEALLEAALACIPPAHLKLFFQRLLRDVKANRTGLPDLVRFWPEERRYELVEVKGPGDKLQDNQIRWLQYCSEHAIPVRVCHVQWRQSNRMPPPLFGNRAGVAA